MKPILNKSKRMLEIESQFGEPLEELLRRKFVDEELSLSELASQLGIVYHILLKWLKLAGVYSRNLNIGGD